MAESIATFQVKQFRPWCLSRSTIVYLSCLLLFVSIHMQFLSVYQFSGGTMGIKLYHVLLVCFFPFVVAKKLIFPRYILLFFIYITCASCVSYAFILHPNLFLAKYFFSIYVFAVGMYVVKILGSRTLSLMRFTALILFGVIIVNIILNFQTILVFLLQPYGHPEFFSIFGGGPNLEATWMGLLTSFFLGSPLLWFFSFICVGISMLYASRVGLISVSIILIFTILSNKTRPVTKVLLSIAGVGSILLFLSINPYAMKRFTEIGTDPGSTGRLRMWEVVPKVFTDSPFIGYGAGNAASAIKNVGKIEIIEDNVHNYYLQLMLDFGAIGLFLYFVILLRLFWFEKRNAFSNPYIIYIFTYALLSFVQFKGADALFWLVCGIYEASRKQNITFT